MDPFISSIIGFAVPVALHYLFRRLLHKTPAYSQPISTDDGKLELALTTSIKAIFLGTALLMCTISIAALYFVEGDDTAIVMVVFIPLLIAGVVMGYQVLTLSILFDHKGVRGVTFIGKKNYIAWDNIKQVDCSDAWWGIKLSDPKDNIVHVTAMVYGFSHFIGYLNKYSPHAQWTKNAQNFVHSRM